MPRLNSNSAQRSADGASPDAPPRYAAIKQSIHDAIRDGRLKPGDRVPSEAELVGQFEDARAQIDELVDDLEKTAAETQSAEASDALRQSLSRIQSLSASLDEAEQLTDRNL